MENLLKPTEAAEILNLSMASLSRLRQRKIGPEYIKLDTGTIRYQKQDLIKWIQEQREETK